MPYTRPPGPRIAFDKEEIVKFLRLIDAKAVAFTFQTFKEKGDITNPEIFPRIIHAGKMGDVRKEHAVGAGIYVTVNETDGKGRALDHIVRVRAVWQEDDAGYDGAFPLAPSLIVESSPGHFHRYWLVADEWKADEQGRADFAAVMERMVESYSSDKSAKDIARVLRVPGFLHRKADKGPVAPFMVHIIEANGRRYSRADIIAAFPKVEREQKKTSQREWKAQDDDDQRIASALHTINADDRDLWLQMGMALKDHYGESGRALWDQWSRRSEKFDEREQDKAWRSLRRQGVTLGTLFHHAKQAGWKDERARKREGGEGGSGNTPNGEGKKDDGSPPPNTGGKASGERSAVLVRADRLKPESISWAWKNRFAFGKMAMIAGDPGLGKSTILIEIAALHSIAGEFPCGEGKALPCEILFLTAEDGLRDTLVPRLMAAEADLSKIHFLTGTKIEGAASDDTAMFDITRDIAVLRKVFAENPAIRILIIDPLTAYLGAGTKAKENTDVRRVLTPLVKLIEEFAVLLLANNHLNKSGGKALYRILDSIAFVALGRTIHLVVEDTDNRDLKKFLCDKSNIGSKPLGLTYIIQKFWIKGELGEEIETSRIVWGTDHIDETADEALTPEVDTTTAKGEAVEFLQIVLRDGRVKVHDIEAEARAACLLGGDQPLNKSKPFRDAKDDLKIVSSREGFGPGAIWYWSLPHHAPQTVNSTIGAHRRHQAPSPKNRAPMESEGAYDEN